MLYAHGQVELDKVTWCVSETWKCQFRSSVNTRFVDILVT
jgi:hypothetical protein